MNGKSKNGFARYTFVNADEFRRRLVQLIREKLYRKEKPTDLEKRRAALLVSDALLRSGSEKVGIDIVHINLYFEKGIYEVLNDFPIACRMIDEELRNPNQLLKLVSDGTHIGSQAHLAIVQDTLIFIMEELNNAKKLSKSRIVKQSVTRGLSNRLGMAKEGIAVP